MSKINKVVKFEVIRQLKKPSFWISLLLLPLLLFGIIGLSTLDSYTAEDMLKGGSSLDKKTIGLTNDSGMFLTLQDDFNDYIKKENLETKIVTVTEKEEGINKVVSGELDIYYYIPADLISKMTVEIYHQALNSGLLSDFGTPLSAILAEKTINQLGLEDKIAISRQLQFSSLALNHSGEQENILGKAIIPLSVLAIFYILICVFGNRLATSLAEEKENRISEMLLTSVNPKNFVIGKIISLIILGFIQIFVFIIPIISTLIIFRDNPMVAQALSIISFEPWSLISNIILLIASYFLFAGGCTFISSLTPTARDASSYAGVIIIGTMLPIFFLSNFFAETTGAIVYILTYFPLSAPIALMLRNAFGSLPTYELVLGLFELIICSAGVLVLTVKSFQKNAINFSVVKPNFKIRTSWKR